MKLFHHIRVVVATLPLLAGAGASCVLAAGEKTPESVVPAGTGWQVALGIIWLVSVCLVGFIARRTGRNDLEVQLRQREETLAAAEFQNEELRSLFDLAQVGIFRSRLDGSAFITANRACAEMYGFESLEAFMQEVRPRDLYAAPDVRNAMLDAIRSNGRVDNMELDMVRRDGKVVPMMMNATLHAKEGYIQGAGMDVSAYKEAERQLRANHTFMQSILNAMPTPMFFKDAAARYQMVNRAFEVLMGQNADDLLGKSVYDIAPQHLADKYHEMDKALLESRGPAIQRYEYSVAADGGMRDVVFNKESMFNEEGELLGLVGVIVDITERKRIENSLRRAEERYRALYMNAAEGIFTVDVDGHFVGVNPAMARMFAFDSPQAMIAEVQDMAAELFESPEVIGTLMERLRTERVVTGFEARARRHDGQGVWVSISARGVFGVGDRLERMEGLVVDISALKQAEAELARLVVTDPLTGIANRIGMTHELERMLGQAARTGCQIGLLFVDLDGFKPINDQYGHHTGDQLLQQVAQRFSDRLRNSDLAARVGGDEFAILLWDVQGPEAVAKVGEELAMAMAVPFECDEAACAVGASMGGSLYPMHGSNASELLRAADNAMYEAKRTGASFRFAKGTETVPGAGGGPIPRAAARVSPDAAGAAEPQAEADVADVY